MVDFKQIEYDVENATATITFNRPDNMNALTKILEAELRDAFDRANEDPGIRAIILTGNGRAFCAGMDMEELEVLPPDDIQSMHWMRPYDMNRRADFQTRYSYFPSIRKPIVAAINGAAAGLGLIFAAYCDFRIASDTAVFATAFAKRGLIAEHGIAWILPRIIGHANALDLLMTSRKIGAQEAHEMGFLNKVVPPNELIGTARALAHTLSTDVSPRSVRIMKRQVWDASFESLAENIARANDEMFKSINSEDFKEGVAHFIERREPRFTGR